MLVTNAAIDSALRAYLSSADGNKVVPSATNENNPAKQTAVRRRNARQTRPRECGTKRYSNACLAVSKTCHPVIAWEQNANASGSEFLASERERLLKKSE